MKHLKKIIISILIFCLVFCSSPVVAHAETDWDSYYLNIIQNVQSNKKIYGGATNYLLFSNDEYYILLISQSTFGTAKFNFNDVEYTGITGGGWFFKSKNLDLTDSADDWELLSFSNNNYSMDYYNENVLTFINTSGQPIISNTAIDSNYSYINDDPIWIEYCSQEIEGFCKQGAIDVVEPEEDEDMGILEKILVAVLTPIVDFLGAIAGFLETFFDLLGELFSYLFIPPNFEESLTQLSDSIKKSFGMENISFDSIVGEEKEFPSLKVDLYGQTITILDSSYLVNFINEHRKYIRAFFSLVLILYNINQIMGFTKQKDNTGGEEA